jgi:hypothetical protein
MNRHQRALKVTVILALFLVLPISYRVWLEYGSEYSKLDSGLGTVQPFVLRDTKDIPLTKETLARSVSVVLNIPASMNPEHTEIIKNNVTFISKWISENLILSNPEEKNPLNLLVIGDDFGLTTPNWRKFNAKVESGSLIPEKYSPDDPLLVLIDPNLEFAGTWSLSKEQPNNTLEKVFSRTIFEQYLGNYLSRRTFMGPKRN